MFGWWTVALGNNNYRPLFTKITISVFLFLFSMSRHRFFTNRIFKQFTNILFIWVFQKVFSLNLLQIFQNKKVIPTHNPGKFPGWLENPRKLEKLRSFLAKIQVQPKKQHYPLNYLILAFLSQRRVHFNFFFWNRTILKFINKFGTSYTQKLISFFVSRPILKAFPIFYGKKILRNKSLLCSLTNFFISFTFAKLSYFSLLLFVNPLSAPVDISIRSFHFL